MKVIPISGVIGWDVTGSQIRGLLKEANGEEIEIQLASVGGLVFDGLEIYNLIKNYEGKKTARLVGVSASMGSYIPLAADRIIAEENSVVMIHNAWGGAIGQASDLRAEANVLDGLSAILAEAYAKKTGKTSEEIHAAMDAETWFFGHEMVEFGLVDEIIGQPDESKKEESIKSARLAMADAKKLVSEYEGGDNVRRVAALVDSMRPQPKAEKPGVAVAAGTPAIKPKGSTKMTLEQLKAEHPDAYAQAVALGRADGIKAEQDRFRELSAWTEGHNADTVKIANEAIHSGKTFAEVQSQLMSAAAKGPRQLDGANPPSAATASSTASGTFDIVALTEEEKAVARGLGITEEAMLAQKKKDMKNG